MHGFSSSESDGSESDGEPPAAAAHFGAVVPKPDSFPPPKGMEVATVRRRETFDKTNLQSVVDDTSFRRGADEELLSARLLRTEPGWRSQFDSLRVAASVARRIFDTKLLPPHSRTLNFSALKTLLSTVAMLSNRTVKEFYDAFNDSDAAAFERASAGDAELRRLKADIREYVDRSLSPVRFLETELLASNFTAAFTECLEELRANAGESHPLVRLLTSTAEVELDWDELEVALVLWRHADMRGNVDVTGPRTSSQPPDVGASRAVLTNPYAQYNMLQFAQGNTLVLQDELVLTCMQVSDIMKAKIKAKLRTLGFLGEVVDELKASQSIRQKLWYIENPELTGALDMRDPPPPAYSKANTTSPISQHQTVLKRILYAFEERHKHGPTDEPITTDEPVTLFDIALLGGLHPRTYGLLNKKVPTVRHPSAEVAQKVAVFIQEKMFEMQPVQKNLENTKTHLENMMGDDTKEWSKKALEIAQNTIPASDLELAKEAVRKIMITTHAAIQTAYNLARAEATPEKQIRSLTNAVAAAAQRAADEISEPYYSNYELDSFFQKCMHIFDNKLLKLREEIEDDGFTRDADLGMVLFTLPLPSRSSHTSYLRSERNPVRTDPTPKDAGLGIFGPPVAPKKDAALTREQALRLEYERERAVYNDKYPEIFPLERYCFECLERGTELYMRVTHTLIIKKLEELRKQQKEVTDAMLRPFCQCVSLVIQRAEINNPRLQGAGASTIRKRQRDCSYALLEARYKLARACNYAPPVRLTH